ncbi:glycosyltransferase family 2 protein [Deinococcus peraridilitoris]|uniref:Glycosyl transferase n=1 Tax=Deinococcus peraridilitoris (strain DSM 19664 / LMG 22246 / CIP 109416 / KR-200) TaxID=937777 RepID=K9ZZY4_DEIPD|nr:glycosyltransferase family A protein [Deinococcus peraridilitoris]AFZ66497.1 glycosyl transferase [Deinococcus peraridilitoris DSM 19664]
MERPMLTIAIPNYNGGENLKRALDSCRNIDLLPEQYEVLVIDNASGDDSVALVLEYKATMPMLRIETNNTNIGRVENWNRALELGRGKYLLFIFANDAIADDPQLHRKLKYMSDWSAGMMTTAYWRSEGSLPKLWGQQTDQQCEVLAALPYVKSCLDTASLPFAPMQKIIFDFDIIRLHQIKFDPGQQISTDQLFAFTVALHSRVILRSVCPHLVWYSTTQRFHNSITIGAIVQADIEVIDQLQLKFPVRLNRVGYLAGLLDRVIRNRFVPSSPFSTTGDAAAVRFILRRAGVEAPLVFFRLVAGIIKAFGRVLTRRLHIRNDISTTRQ